MKDIRVILVDDEPLACAGLESILSEDFGVEIVGRCGSGAEAIRSIERLEPDLVFLDIELPDLDGFQILERLESRTRPEVVFVTAHFDRAIRAFEVRALDYVTKPLKRARVHEALARARHRVRLGRLDREAARPNPSFRTPLALKSDGRVKLIDQTTVDWVEADDDHVVVHAGGQSWRARETLGAIGRRLDPARFVRIHRSTIVALGRVRELEPWFHGDYLVTLQNGTRLKLSRTYRGSVARVLGRDV